MAPDVADAIEILWESEEIPDKDHLYMRVHRQYLSEDGNPEPSAFRDQGSGMSTDWDKYSTAEATKALARNPVDNAVISMNVGVIRDIPGQIVSHSPSHHNRAHTDVVGKKDTEARVKFSRSYRMVLPLTR